MKSRLDLTLTALSDSTRRQLLQRLAQKPCRAGELASGFAISRPAICKHARVLKRAGLIRAGRHGREQIYELAPSGSRAIDELIRTLQRMGSFWDTALESFKQFAEGNYQPSSGEETKRNGPGQS